VYITQATTLVQQVLSRLVTALLAAAAKPVAIPLRQSNKVKFFKKATEKQWLFSFII
jgi:hypothetical protein